MEVKPAEIWMTPYVDAPCDAPQSMPITIGVSIGVIGEHPTTGEMYSSLPHIFRFDGSESAMEHFDRINELIEAMFEDYNIPHRRIAYLIERLNAMVFDFKYDATYRRSMVTPLIPAGEKRIDYLIESMQRIVTNLLHVKTERKYN